MYYIILRQKQNGRRFADDIFKHILSYKNWDFSILIKIFLPKVPIINEAALAQLLTWRRPEARLAKAYDVTIQRYRNSHAKIKKKQ